MLSENCRLVRSAIDRIPRGPVVQPGTRLALGTARGARSPELTITAAALAITGLLPADVRVEPADVMWQRRPGGQPCLRVGASTVAALREAGLSPKSIEVSNTHERGTELVGAACSTSIRGIGVDLVQLRRIERHGPEQLRRLARRFMSSTAFDLFMDRMRDAPELAAEYVAASFALMEAASKALGTGLRMGLGVGGSLSVPMASIQVTAAAPGWRIEAVGEAGARLASLRCDRLAGACWSDGELVCACVTACSSG